MELRRATPDDVADVGELTVAAYAEFVMSSDSYVDQLRDAARRDREAELWVAVGDRGALLGCVTVCPPTSPWRELAAAEDPTEGEFRMLAVDPAVRGRGVGQSLVRLAVDRARQHGARRVLLSSLPQMTGAHRLYERIGFRRDPRRDRAPVPGVGLLAYQLDISPDSQDDR
jgi:ribosomal protein S18 acetylase RimI-like enzyme